MVPVSGFALLIDHFQVEFLATWFNDGTVILDEVTGHFTDDQTTPVLIPTDSDNHDVEVGLSIT